MSAQSPVRLFSPVAIFVATVLGTPLAGCCLLGLNCQRLGQLKRARHMFAGMLVYFVAMLAFLLFVPEDWQNRIPTPVYFVVQTTLVGALYRAYVKDLVALAVAEGRAKVGAWGQALGVGLGGLLLFATAILALAWAGVFPPFSGEKLTFGPLSHDVYYDGISQDEAERIANALQGVGYLDLFDFSIYFQIRKQGDRVQIVLPFDTDAVLKPENQGLFQEVKRALLQDYNLDIDIVLSHESWTETHSTTL